MNHREIIAAHPELAAELAERLVRYAKVWTTSDRHAEVIPSTPNQKELSDLLAAELRAMGVSDLYRDEHLYLVAKVPAAPGCEGKPSIGLMAHIDTAGDITGKDARPRLVENYDGKPVCLSGDWILAPKDFPALLEHKGDSLIVTDGKTLLGADDKAGISEIMTALRFLLAHPELPRGPLEIVFTPDEETGKGMDLFPLSVLSSKACYTIDGTKAGEIEAECFNAYLAKVEFSGRAIHIGAARGKLANAASMAAHFAAMLPRSESPEATDGWYGYYCPLEIHGGLDSATLEVYVRDFADEGMERRLDALKAIARAIEVQFPLGKVELSLKKQYLNMRKKLDERPEVLEKALEAAKRAGVVPEITPIRGGTDGARLTEMGIPCPNIFTGCYNYHSRFEFASLGEMVLAALTVVELVKAWAE
jgi:tripeptide aminopeptidase